VRFARGYVLSGLVLPGDKPTFASPRPRLDPGLHDAQKDRLAPEQN
jgi:hypothetical protein